MSDHVLGLQPSNVVLGMGVESLAVKAAGGCQGVGLQAVLEEFLVVLGVVPLSK